MLRSTFDDGVASILLDRAEARNALAITDWCALAEICRGLGRSDARAVVLRSAASGIFSAGADIGEFGELQADERARTRFRETMRIALDALHALPMPVIAAVSGGCYGAGVALVLAADFAVADHSAGFATTPARLGLGYPGEDVARLIDRVGEAWAARMLYAGEAVSAERAKVIGLVTEVADDAAGAAQALAAQIVGNAPGAVRLLKRTVRNPRGEDLDRVFDERFASAEFAERLTAFRMRKRK